MRTTELFLSNNVKKLLAETAEPRAKHESDNYIADRVGFVQSSLISCWNLICTVFYLTQNVAQDIFNDQ